jgi:hypothetical protein
MNVAIQYELQNQYQTHQRLSLNIRPNISRYDANTDGRYEENDVGGISERSTFADFFAFFAIFLATFFSAFAAIFSSFFGLTIDPSVVPFSLPHPSTHCLPNPSASECLSGFAAAPSAAWRCWPRCAGLFYRRNNSINVERDVRVPCGGKWPSSLLSRAPCLLAATLSHNSIPQ